MEDEGTVGKGDCQKIGQALGLLGAAYRGDWSNFDGRTLRYQLDGLARYLKGQATGFDLERWAFDTNICPVSGGWVEYCDNKTDSAYECGHLAEYYNAKETVNESE